MNYSPKDEPVQGAGWVIEKTLKQYLLPHCSAVSRVVQKPFFVISVDRILKLNCTTYVLIFFQNNQELQISLLRASVKPKPVSVSTSCLQKLIFFQVSLQIHSSIQLSPLFSTRRCITVCVFQKSISC